PFYCFSRVSWGVNECNGVVLSTKPYDISECNVEDVPLQLGIDCHLNKSGDPKCCSPIVNGVQSLEDFEITPEMFDECQRLANESIRKRNSSTEYKKILNPHVPVPNVPYSSKRTTYSSALHTRNMVICNRNRYGAPSKLPNPSEGVKKVLHGSFLFDEPFWDGYNLICEGFQKWLVKSLFDSPKQKESGFVFYKKQSSKVKNGFDFNIAKIYEKSWFLILDDRIICLGLKLYVGGFTLVDHVLLPMHTEIGGVGHWILGRLFIKERILFIYYSIRSPDIDADIRKDVECYSTSFRF
ncbi:adenylate cyclase type 6, partial [Striga asiatica]